MKSNTKKLAILLVIGLVFPLILNYNFNFSNNHNHKPNVVNLKKSGGYSESFIHIDGSIPGNWSDTVSTYSWCDGSGTWEDPYIIENVTVDCGGTGSGILIENSDTDYFIIRNCTVYNAGDVNWDGGILLENVNNGTLTNNNCSNNPKYGIALVNDCDNNTISGNTANNNSLMGMRFDSDCNYNNISGNTANNNTFGIYITNSDNNNISGNTANNNDYGIEIHNSDNNKFLNNIVNYNNRFGVYFASSDWNSIMGNTVDDNAMNGIELASAHNNTITGNTVNRNLGGLLLIFSNDNYISENVLKNNGLCIFEYHCTDNIIENNDCSGSTLQAPIEIDGSATGIGAHNWMWAESQSWCSGAGTWSDPYIIENLDINGLGTEYGINIQNSDVFFIIQGCTIMNSFIGIHLNNVNSSRLIDNNCSNNYEQGITLRYCDNNTISGNTANYNSNGIYLYHYCDNNTISGNIINKNHIGITFDTGCDNNIIYQNFFLKNAIHAFDDGIGNTWNSTTIGNYWDNWTSPDISPLDGIVDVPYTYIGGSAGSIDYLPIAEDGVPVIVINSPDPGDVFGVSAPSFNVIVTDIKIDSMWYSLDGGLHNYTFTVNGTIDQSAWAALPEGNVTITFYAKDIIGNEAFESVVVTKTNDIGPVIIITIIIISIIGGAALIGIGYIYFKKRQNPDRISE
ncbi:MAG: right-handed parallel beta-helix repeat-containing protein [Candidatus Lokiarchaeota archaeon]|nr:right-handed parallel beta-helix repeat-containing protein [Candidatus Lokiarchaeota archaeon]